MLGSFKLLVTECFLYLNFVLFGKQIIIIGTARLTCEKYLCLLNVVLKQGILINTHKTKQATFCRVTCNRVPFITHYCVFIQVMTQH